MTRTAAAVTATPAPANALDWPGRDARVAVVIVTRDRCASLLRTLTELAALPEAPRVIVVDNGSTDGTVERVRASHPDVAVVALSENRGSAARTIGVEAVDAPYIAFADDDSWWAAGALRQAADLFDMQPTLGLVAARVLLGDERRPDPVCAAMAASPLPRAADLPGPAVLGFIACGAVVRRSAYLACGGFHERFGIGGEEELLALDLAAAGWQLAYVETIVAHHHPSSARNRDARRRGVTRNALWCAWLRRPAGSALRQSVRLAHPALTDRWARRGLLDALHGLPWVLRERRVLPPPVETAARLLDGDAPCGPPAYPDWEETVPTGDALAPLVAGGVDVSVVIATHRRDDSLRRLLGRLLAQDYPAARREIIVVDDAQSESVPRLVAALTEEHPGAGIHSLPGARRGPAAARNVGWRAARGAVIAFIDDDAYPADARWLTEGTAPFRDRSVVGVSGAVTVPVDKPPTDFQRNVQGLEAGVFITCNAFYRRSALIAVGGFDEAFRAPYREDSDLQFRVEAAGGRLVRNPRARVVHPAPRGRFAVSLWLQRYSQYNALIAKKHPRRYRRELERRPPWPYYGIVGAGAAALALGVTGRRGPALLTALVWAALEGRFFQRRARGVVHTPRHLAGLALTSLLIPPLSVYWRLRAALPHALRLSGAQREEDAVTANIDLTRPPLPHKLQAEVTGACNLRCRMCIVRYRPPLPRSASLSLERFRRLLEQMPDVTDVSLQGIGEPLLAPDIYRMVAYASARGLRAGFNTNATLLTQQAGERLIAAGLAWLCISLDGAGPETYEFVRDGAAGRRSSATSATS